MTKMISLREASQAFARRVRHAEEGQCDRVMRKGTPVAPLGAAAGEQAMSPAQEAALARTRARMEEGWSLGPDRFDRDRLHER